MSCTLPRRALACTHVGYRKITVERPMRLNFQATPERIARLDDEKGFASLAETKKRDASGEKQQAEGRDHQQTRFHGDLRTKWTSRPGPCPPPGPVTRPARLARR